ncbi:MAG: Fic family protein [Candidatus Peribacteraceae bacterium]|nr:Fic family protein [Candidatus Peribacteraceae bacterium]MDD5742995.1 Fic family protein [Candidatus Peribacteraceae bacterium]
MTIPQKLKIIRQLSGLSQTELAQKLGVTFVAFNRWVNGKAAPRRKAQDRIDALYRECTGLKLIPEEELEAKKAILVQRAKKEKNVLHAILESPDIRDQFILTLTYTSNSIEGSTLTEAETAIVLFHNAALPDKTLAEQLEAKNHQTALLHLFQHLSQEKPVNEDLLLKMHGMLMNGLRPDAGSYRHHGVRIVGADLPTANALKVPLLMEELAKEFMMRGKGIIAHAAAIHARFEQIHPFSDGNGRIGRLLLHAMLLRENLPPAVIRPERKRLYYTFLNTAQKKGDTSLLQDFLCDAVSEGWGIVQRSSTK